LQSFSGCPDVHDFCFCLLFASDKVVSLPFNSFSLDDNVGPSRRDVVTPEVLPEIVQVDDSFSFGDVNCSRSSGGARVASFSLAHRLRLRRCSETLEIVPDYFSLGAESSTAVATPELLRRIDRSRPQSSGSLWGAPGHRRSSGGCPLGGLPGVTRDPHHW